MLKYCKLHASTLCNNVFVWYTGLKLLLWINEGFYIFNSQVVFLLQIKSVKVSNVSLGATLQDVQEFFSFSGDIFYVEMQRLVDMKIYIPIKLSEFRG